MASEEYKAGYPLAPANGFMRSDQEAATADARELRRQKHKKWCLYGIAFVIFQTGIIALFSMTIMKIRTPKFRVRSASFNTFDVQTTSPSFNLTMNAQLGVKNANFGPYKYDSTTVYFYYKDTQVGSAVIPNSKASFRSTKKINVVVDLGSTNIASNSGLANDVNSGILPLTSQSTLNGKVELMFIFKKKKAIQLNCNMNVNTVTRELQDLVCK